ncbi:enhancer of mRNA-decapping protein 4-like [Battus philenor]|uniref:enhancer of mRNA-decapping protein 4-like n=1 Tax=Battus philenor TaxID=42288 RepID=UPI0035CF2462
MYHLKLHKESQLIRSKSLSSLELLDNVSNGLTGYVVDIENCKRRKESTDSDCDFNLLSPVLHEERKLNTTPIESSQSVESVFILEKKIEKLNDLLQDQQNTLIELKKDLKVVLYNYALVKENNLIHENGGDNFTLKNDKHTPEEVPPVDKGYDRALSFMNALEIKPMRGFEADVKDVLIEFLRSDGLKDEIVSAMENCVRDVIKTSFTQSLAVNYLPVLEQSHHHLMDHVTKELKKAFEGLEHNSCVFYDAVSKKTTTLRKSLDRHKKLLEDVKQENILRHLQQSLQEILQKELKEWREGLFKIMLREEEDESVIDDDWLSFDSAVPPSPPQPSDPQTSMIEQMLKSAEINKRMLDGDVNGAFEMALSSSNLALVMTACRAADPSTVFSQPCRLHQPVLLSLIQQLATDMVHDTQLKCRYLEEAIVNLNRFDVITRKFLPIVVTDVKKHLTKFLVSYPNHMASRKLSLIIMATDNLLK